jgi:hypothetical protein
MMPEVKITYKWFKDFNNGRTSMDYNEWSGWTSRSEPLIAQVKNVIHGNRWLTAQKLHKRLEYLLVHDTILTEDLGIYRVPVKFVSRFLTDGQKLQRFSIRGNLLQRTNDANLLKNVIIRNKMWVYSYDTDTKQQSSHWKSPTSPCPKKAWLVCLRVKAMLLFFDRGSEALSIRSWRSEN